MAFTMENNFRPENNYSYKMNAKLNDVKNYLDKIGEIAKELGIYAEDIDRMRNQSLREVEKILSTHP